MLSAVKVVPVLMLIEAPEPDEILVAATDVPALRVISPEVVPPFELRSRVVIDVPALIWMPAPVVPPVLTLEPAMNTEPEPAEIVTVPPV